ncbi:SecY-interacting protein [Citrobacter rodentium]|uniref:Protein Syd n=2 Tax=Citrobacter rodentium TaxID=67825 RepID=D2TIL2_CITRI|nr:SecY-interacting protein [Citrobacter rodentium]KIQ53187.1 SecY interacting protein Syd [Citrobacter rodentium]QBY29292.1 SecY-interacting protein [Citrobacter rodentium]UHO33302.1 SecY-interacting protein [Citrobacter rodentium NBRC 105723 = DSM 16636]CBG89574.1 putative SecY-interacting protein [Citrobacter rodentium ICC168]HAT8015803.1 SecY-interacting protein [Citrobacter rodentium NBRC 105723 = DSM 16636]
MDEQTALALKAFTTRYCDAWHEKHHSWPLSEALYGVPSPCIISTTSDAVYWQPQPFVGEQSVNAVERAFDIVVQPAIHSFYTTQFAGDMPAQFAGETLCLLQTWSEDDFRRVQENLIGHLVTQKRLKLSPTLFIATLENELDVISVCNLSGEVVKERLGTRNRTVLAPSLAEFLTELKPLL